MSQTPVKKDSQVAKVGQSAKGALAAKTVANPFINSVFTTKSQPSHFNSDAMKQEELKKHGATFFSMC